VTSTPACDYVPKPTLKMNVSKVKVKVEQSETEFADDEQLTDSGTVSKDDSHLDNIADESKDNMEGIISEEDFPE